VALYHLPSFFNHSSRPNCNRYSIGDVMFFVSNQDIPSGAEVCISYLEHDVLCESAYRRNRLLSMNFDDTRPDERLRDDAQRAAREARGPELPVVDSDVQNELMAMDPFDRLAAIEELARQASGGAKLPDDDGGGGRNQEQPVDDSRPELEEGAAAVDAQDGAPWFQCDSHNLRIIQALTLDSLGKADEALELWEESIQFVRNCMPPLEESLAVLHAQAALCSLRANDPRAESAARAHAAEALRVHQLLFGGGVERFRRRCWNDLTLALRPQRAPMDSSNGSPGGASPVDELWPLAVATSP
jgi:hypothetical protein